MVDHQELITQLALLRFKAQVSYDEHQHTKQAFDLTRAFLMRGHQSVREGQGELHVDIEGERIRGYVMLWRQPISWYGAPVQYCALDFDWHDSGSVMWATQKLLELGPRLEHDCELMLSARYHSILGVALGAGFGIESVILLGNPQRSLELLMERYQPPAHLGHLNLDIRPLSNRREVDYIVKLKREYFTAHPEFCWFGAREEHLEQQHAELSRTVLRTRSRPNPHLPSSQASPVLTEHVHQWVIYRERTFLGNFSYTASEESAQWGHSAGLDIMLHPLIQHRSVVKTVYRIMLESMIKQNVSVYKGGTAQPAVMGLGRLMDRPLFSWVLRRNTAFPTEHFSLYLPDTSSTQVRSFFQS